MSPRHLSESIVVSHLLGGLTESEGLQVDSHLHACPRCTGLVAQTNDDLAQLAVALPTPPVPAMLREGLLHAMGEINRFTDFMGSLERQLNVQRATVEGLLDNVDCAGAWEDTLVAGLQTYQVDRHTWFLRAQPGHVVKSVLSQDGGTALILQGTCRDHAGKVFAAGGTLVLPADGHAASYVALGGVDFICLFRNGSNDAAAPAVRWDLQLQA